MPSFTAIGRALHRLEDIVMKLLSIISEDKEAISMARERVDALQRALDENLNKTDALERALGAERSRIDQFESRPHWLLEFAIPIVSLLALLLFAGIRIGQIAFYNRLGVLPEEVGLSYAVTIGRSAIALAFILAVSLPAFLYSYIPVDTVSKSWAYRLIVFLALLVYGVFSVEWFRRLGFSNPTVLAFLAASALALGWLRDARRTTKRAVFLIAIVIVPLALLLSVREIVNTGNELASQVRRGQDVDPFKPTALLLGVSAQSVEINWVDQKSPLGLAVPHRLLYLGETDGVFILYVFDEQPARILRISRDSASLNASLPP